MLYLGLDIGTTSVCGVLLDGETGVHIANVSKDHEAGLKSERAEEDMQDPGRILASAAEIINMLSGSEIGGMCITGQVHGILYIDDAGNAVSPFYTWQDRRGRCTVPEGGQDWVSWMRERTGCIVPAGYGMLTHCINKAEGKFPGNASGVTTILDYVGMQLCGNTRPVTDPTNAHSLGLYDQKQRAFLCAAMEEAGIDPDLFPEIVPVGFEIGRTKDGIPVFTAVGDNQAGFAGAVEGRENVLLVNIGTSAQLSVHTDFRRLKNKDGNIPGWVNGLEVRPYLHDDFIITGASLSGGSAYHLLEQFFRDICKTFCRRDPGNLFQQMNNLDLEVIGDEERLNVTTHFYGTRDDWNATGSIKNIGKENFHTAALVDGVLRGIAEELFQFYRCLPEDIQTRIAELKGVGNSIRKNAQLRNIIRERFQLPLTLSGKEEDAAFGAAAIAAGSF